MKENFHRKVLKNGMTVLLEKRDVPVVSCAIAVRAGGIHEDLSEKGISHFIEHMFYKGTKKRTSRDISSEIEKIGGELNGFTSEELVAYWFKLPSKKYKFGLEVLGDIVNNSLFDKKELEKEREVILEEVSLYKDNPRLHVFDEIQKMLYGGTMSIHLIGTENILRSFKREDLVKKFEELYSPNNLILCAVGNCEFEDLVKFAEKNFKGEPKEISVKEIILKNESKIENRKGIDQANLIFGFHSPLGGDKKSYAAQVLSVLMAGGMSSRLFSEIREKRNLAYSVKGDIHVGKDFSYSIIYVGAKKENVELVKNLILEEYKKVSKNLTEEELKEVKEQLIGNYNISMEDSQMQMVQLLATEVESSAEKFYDYEKNISKVKLEDVKSLAAQVKEGNYSFFALVPEGK